TAASENPGSHDLDSLLVGQAWDRQGNTQGAILEARQFHRFSDGSHHSARNARTAQLRFPHGGIARLEHRVELGQQFRRILSPSLRIAETRIDEPVLALERASELLELVLLHDAERKVTAVGRHEDSRRRLPAVADVAGSLERPAR